MDGRSMRRSLIYLLIIVAITAIVFTLFSNAVGGSQEISINEVVAMTARGDVASIEVNGNVLDILTVSGEPLTSRKEDGSSIVEILERAGVDPVTTSEEIIVKGSSGLSSFVGILFNFLPLIFFGAILMFMMRQAQGNSSQTFSFGKSRARVAMGDSPSVSFDDVAGV